MTKQDGYWIKPTASFSLSVLRAEGEQSEFKATIADTAETPDDDWHETLVDLTINMKEYPAHLLLARLDAIRAALSQWIDLADDPSAAPIVAQLSQQIQQLQGGDRSGNP